MKKFLTIIFVLALSISYQFANAQAKSSIGVGFIYASEIDQPGFNFRGDFKVGSGWAITPDICFYFPEKNGTWKTTFSEFNVNAHYVFSMSSAVGFYPLMGFNFTSVKVKETSTDFKDSNNEFGMNIGMGLEWYFNNRITGFSEVKYVVSDYDHAVIALGVLIGI